MIKRRGRIFLFCMIEEEKGLDVQIKWQIKSQTFLISNIKQDNNISLGRGWGMLEGGRGDRKGMLGHQGIWIL